MASNRCSFRINMPGNHFWSLSHGRSDRLRTLWYRGSRFFLGIRGIGICGFGVRRFVLGKGRRDRERAT